MIEYSTEGNQCKDLFNKVVLKIESESCINAYAFE